LERFTRQRGHAGVKGPETPQKKERKPPLLLGITHRRRMDMVVIEGTIGEVMAAVGRVARRNVPVAMGLLGDGPWEEVMENIGLFIGFGEIASWLPESLRISIDWSEAAIFTEIACRESSKEWVTIVRFVIDEESMRSSAEAAAAQLGKTTEEVLRLPWFSIPGQVEFFREVSE